MNNAETAHEAGGFAFVQVAFAGHNRPSEIGDKAALQRQLRDTFGLLAEAGVSRARLLTGLAAGADVLAVRAWREVDVGPIHVVFPFLHDRPPSGVGDPPEGALWLDGAATQAAGRNPHLAQTRWILGAADVLVVAWTGKSARGAGGTADAVRLALEHGVPVIWIRPGDAQMRLIQPQHLEEDVGFLEFIEKLEREAPPLVDLATVATVRRALLDVGLEEARGDGPEPASPEANAAVAYRLFRRLLGGSPTRTAEPEPPEDLKGQLGFARLSSAFAVADGRANRLGAVHRSHQVILLGLAMAAAIVGSAPALWPEIKVAAVAAELGLALIALLIWRDSERGHRHQHWAISRRLAEDLRLERIAWAIGMPSARQSLALGSSEEAARQRRLAGLPTGAFDPDRVQRWGAWALNELIGVQGEYHRREGRLNARISHRVHLLENVSFTALVVVLLAYLATFAFRQALGGETPHWLGGLVFMAGAIAPAIGAAGLALEATLSLGEEAQRSAILAARLESLAASAAADPTLPALQNVASAALRLQRAQEDHWAEGAIRRRLVRGG